MMGMIWKDGNDGLLWEGVVALMLVVGAIRHSGESRNPERGRASLPLASVIPARGNLREGVGGSFPSFSIMGIIVQRRGRDRCGLFFSSFPRARE